MEHHSPSETGFKQGFYWKVWGLFKIIYFWVNELCETAQAIQELGSRKMPVKEELLGHPRIFARHFLNDFEQAQISPWNFSEQVQLCSEEVLVSHSSNGWVLPSNLAQGSAGAAFSSAHMVPAQP